MSGRLSILNARNKVKTTYLDEFGSRAQDSDYNKQRCKPDTLNTYFNSGNANKIMVGEIEEFREWKFFVCVPNLRPSETVCVTGSCKELGNWEYTNVVPLIKESGTDNWSKVVTVPCAVDVCYRYCICLLDDEFSQHTVRSWETHLEPRKVSISDTAWPTEAIKYGEFDGKTYIDRGWLTSENLLQFKFFNDPFKLKQKLQNRTLFVKLTPVSLKLNNCEPLNMLGLDESLSTDPADHVEIPDDVFTEVATLNKNGSQFQEQEQFGTAYKKGDFLMFNIFSKNIDKLAYLVDFYIYSSRAGPNEPPYHFAYTYILPNILKWSEGQSELPLVCSVKHRPLGSMNLEYLVVKPLTNAKCNMRVTYAKYWNEKWTGLDVGHRGLGSSFKTRDATIRENTIASLKKAAASGADMLEFDVQLSKDFVPIIYHDFYACISIKRKKHIDHTDMLELPVKELTYDQLQKLKVYHRVEGQSNEQRFFDEELEEHQPFPKLIQALTDIDKNVGFNVEIKWTMRLHDGTMELNNPFDLNLYIDKILEILLNHGGNRRIVISCFHPDICTIVRQKQNIYPAMFLTQGVTERFPSYHDARCKNILSAVQHACSAGLLGIVVHTEDLLRDSSQIQLAKDAGLVIFCWGDDNNNKETIRHLKKLGLHAVIYDKLDQYSEKDIKESIFGIEAKESQCIILAKAVELQQEQEIIERNNHESANDSEVSQPKRPKQESTERAFSQIESLSNFLPSTASTVTSLDSVASNASPVMIKACNEATKIN